MSSLGKAGKIAGNLALLLKAERVAQSFMKGVHGRRRTGAGETFWQFRPWASGDARRDIDWRQSAKRDDVFIRQREWEAAQTVWLWRDASASMNFGGQGRGSFGIKREYAETLLLALGIVLLNGGERVGLLGADLAPQTGASAIRRLCDMLPAQKEMTEAARPVAANAHVVLIGDFYFPLEEMRGFCASLAARGVRGVLVQLYDPAEKALPYKGRVRFEDSEGADLGSVDIPQVEAVRAAYAEKFIAHQDALSDMARRFGWRFLPRGTDEKPETVLTQLYDLLGTHA